MRAENKSPVLGAFNMLLLLISISRENMFFLTQKTYIYLFKKHLFVCIELSRTFALLLFFILWAYQMKVNKSKP